MGFITHPKMKYVNQKLSLCNRLKLQQSIISDLMLPSLKTGPKESI